MSNDTKNVEIAINFNMGFSVAEPALESLRSIPAVDSGIVHLSTHAGDDILNVRL